MLAVNVALVRIIPWPSASSMIGMFSLSLAIACCMSLFEKSTPVSTIAIATLFPVTLYNSCTSFEFARFPISEIFECGLYSVYFEWKLNGKSSITWSPVDSKIVILFSGNVTIEKKPLEVLTEFDIPLVRKDISSGEPWPNTIYRFKFSASSNSLTVIISEVICILSKSNENKFFSIISPPRYPNDSLAIIGTSDKTRRSNTILIMIIK